MLCQIKFTPQPKARAYPGEVRRKTIQLYVDGMSLNRIARHLGIHHCTVSLWVKAKAAQLADLPLPAEVKEAEMEEVFTFIGKKKPDLRDHHGGSGHVLLFGLPSRLAENASSYRGDGG